MRTSDEHWVMVWGMLAMQMESAAASWDTYGLDPYGQGDDQWAGAMTKGDTYRARAAAARRRSLAAHKRIMERRDRDSANWEGVYR